MSPRSEISVGSPAHPVAIVALVVVVAATLTAVVRFRPEAWDRPPTPETVAHAPVEPPIEAPSVATLIDAIPWGRIERIETAAGDHRELPAQRETPVLLELPPGEWQVVLSNPAFEEDRLCELSLTGGRRRDCLVEFERLSVDQYFREAGWWR